MVAIVSSPWPRPTLLMAWLFAGALVIRPPAEGDLSAAGPSVAESASIATEPSGDESPVVGDAQRVADLIEGLGSESYATRVRCRQQLADIGLAAFDQLREAQEHPDNEIAIVARQLTAGLEVRWAGPGDSTRVQELLREYGSRSVVQRQGQLRKLAQLPRDESFAALARLSRYEPDRQLARTAAISAMSTSENGPLGPAEDRGASQRSARAAIIAQTIGNDDQVGSRWLRQYAADLSADELDVRGWAELIDQSRQLVVNESSELTSASVSATEILRLAWVVAKRAKQWGDDASGLQLIIEQLDLIPPKTHELVANATRAIDLGFYPAVLEMYRQHRLSFSQSPMLLYAAAEASERCGDSEQSEKLAERALATYPLPPLESTEPGHPSGGQGSEDAIEQLRPEVRQQRAESHLMIASDLVDRGLFRWAEREYELVIDRLEVDSFSSAFARLKLTDLLAELQRHADVIETLQPLADRVDKDDDVKRALIVASFPYPIIRSRIEYHRGLLAIQQNEFAVAQTSLRQAFDLDPTNIDILIQMYRLDGDEAWRAYVRDELQQHIRNAENSVLAAQDAPRIGPFSTSDDDLADKLNNYAWLVANTEGDMARALRYSLLSLKKSPGKAALMDTCARCYFANGDYAAAVEMQRQACREMPYSPTLLRQLAEFEEKAKMAETSADSGGRG